MADKDEEAYLDELLRSMSMGPLETSNVNESEAQAVETPGELPLTEEIEEPAPDSSEMMMSTNQEPVEEQAPDFDMTLLSQMLSGEITPEEVVKEPIPVVEEPVAPSIDTADPNAMMDADAIAALFAQMGGAEETSPIEETLPVEEPPIVEAAPAAEEPVAPSTDTSDENATMDQAAIEALLAQINGEDSAPDSGSEEFVLDDSSLNMDSLFDGDGLPEEDVSLDDLLKQASVSETVTDDAPNVDESLPNMDDLAALMGAGDGDLPSEDVDAGGGNLSVDDMIKAVQGEMSGGFDDIFGAMDGLTTDENSSAVADPLAGQDNYGDADILALDDGLGLDEPVDLNAGGLSEDEQKKLAAMSSEADSTDAAPMELEKEEKKKKKKFSLKNFFLKFSDDEEEKETDSNEEMMKELYGDRDSLADADPEEEFSKNKKKKKEKKVKEKKPKKEKAPKPKKEKKPKKVKEPSNEPKIPIKTIAGAVLFAVIIIVGSIFGSKFANYQLTVRHAQAYFEQKNYSAAYSTLSGLDLKGKDLQLYEKVQTICAVKQGMDGFNAAFERGDYALGLDSLVRAVGWKNENQTRIISNNVVMEVDEYYTQILGVLNRYELTEENALDLYAIRNYGEYMKILQSYGSKDIQ